MSFYSDASLIMYPSGYKANKIYSLKPTDGSGDFDFTRAGTATRVNADGLIESVGAEVPRIDYTGGGCGKLLLEPQRSNLIPYSEDFSDATWNVFGSSGGTCTRTSNYGISPQGIQNSTRVVFSGNNTALYFVISISVESTATIYVKGVAGEVIGFGFGVSVGDGSDFTFNGEWQRLVFSGSSGGSVTINTFSPSRNARDFEIYGAQLEEGSYPTSYIPTAGSIATRAAETATGAGDVNTFNDSEGVLYAEISALKNGDGFMTISVNDGDGTADNHISILYRNTSNEVWAQASGGGTNTNIFLYDVKQDSNNKIAVAYASNSFKIYVNGVLKGSTILNSLPNGLNSINFRNGANDENFYGKTRQIQYFTTRLTDAELEEITSWTSFIEMAKAQNYKTY